MDRWMRTVISPIGYLCMHASDIGEKGCDKLCYEAEYRKVEDIFYGI